MDEQQLDEYGGGVDACAPAVRLGTCPVCGSADLEDRPTGGGECVQCEAVWDPRPGGGLDLTTGAQRAAINAEYAGAVDRDLFGADGARITSW